MTKKGNTQNEAKKIILFQAEQKEQRKVRATEWSNKSFRAEMKSVVFHFDEKS